MTGYLQALALVVGTTLGMRLAIRRLYQLAALGRLRCVNIRDKHRIRSDELHAFAWLLGVARTPLTRAESDPALAAAMA